MEHKLLHLCFDYAGAVAGASDSDTQDHMTRQPK